MMFKLAFISAVLAFTQVSANAVQARDNSLAIRELLVARQGGIPSFPTSASACSDQCTAASNSITGCSDMECMCKQANVASLAECFNCATPYIAQAGSDPNWVETAQQSLDGFVDACSSGGYPLATVKLDAAGSGGGGAATTAKSTVGAGTGAAGSTATVVNASASSPGATQAAGGQSGGSTPGLPGASNSASGLVASGAMMMGIVSAAMMLGL